jgi:hypothetical protein
LQLLEVLVLWWAPFDNLSKDRGELVVSKLLLGLEDVIAAAYLATIRAVPISRVGELAGPVTLSLAARVCFPGRVFVMARLSWVTGTRRAADLIPEGVVEGLGKRAHATLELVWKRLFVWHEALVVERRIVYGKTLEVRRRIAYYKTLVVKKKEEDGGSQ